MARSTLGTHKSKIVCNIVESGHSNRVIRTTTIIAQSHRRNANSVKFLRSSSGGYPALWRKISNLPAPEVEEKAKSFSLNLSEYWKEKLNFSPDDVLMGPCIQ